MVVRLLARWRVTEGEHAVPWPSASSSPAGNSSWTTSCRNSQPTRHGMAGSGLAGRGQGHGLSRSTQSHDLAWRPPSSASNDGRLCLGRVGRQAGGLGKIGKTGEGGDKRSKNLDAWDPLNIKVNAIVNLLDNSSTIIVYI